MAFFNPFSLEGKTIFVTGASSGIGRGIAVACSKMGANLVINGRNATRLHETFALLDGNNHLINVGDLTDEVSLVTMVTHMPHSAGVSQ